MRMKEVQQRAKDMAVKAGGRKADVIRRIQEAEGNERCFQARDCCDQMDCCWREDCLPTK